VITNIEPSDLSSRRREEEGREREKEKTEFSEARCCPFSNYPKLSAIKLIKACQHITLNHHYPVMIATCLSYPQVNYTLNG